MSLDLCIDPFDCEFPGLINEILSLPSENPDRAPVLAASITADGFAYLICNKILYIWSYTQKEKGRPPHAYKLNLPGTGLPYSLDSIQLFHRDASNLPSVLAVSPEGIVRYWPIVGKSYKDREMNLQNEVVLSLLPLREEEYANKFILSTTSGNFHIIEIFKDNYTNPTENSIIFKEILLNTSSFTRRVSAVVFGSQAQKQELIKIVVPKPFSGNRQIDLIAVYQNFIDFNSISQSSIVQNVDISDLVLTELANLNTEKESLSSLKKNTKVYIVDVIFYKKGVVVLAAIAKKSMKHLIFALAHLTVESISSKTANWFNCLSIPEQYRTPIPQSGAPLPKIKLYTPVPGSFILVFPNFVISMENVFTKETDMVLDISKFTEQLLGSACINQFCQVIMRKSGICNVRHLPKGFDLTFWHKFKSEFEIEEPESSLLAKIKKGFSLFASKNLVEAKNYFHQNLEQISSTEEFATTILQMTKNILDRAPPNDHRWNKENGQKNETSVKKGTLIQGQIEDKMANYKMIVMFLRYFGMFTKLNHPSQALGNRIPLSVFAEYGEKLFAMHLTFIMFGELTLPIVDSAIRALSLQIKTQNGMMENTQLSNRDYFAKEVTSFEELIPAVMRAQQKELEENSNARKDVIFNEVGTFFSVVIEALTFYNSEDWTIHVKSEEPNWTNNSQILYQFTKEFNLIFDLIDSGSVPNETKECLLKNVHLISRFILSQQSRFQRNNSAIIQRFYKFGKVDLALRLAEEYHDFTTLIKHCYETLPDIERRCRLEQYKQQFKDEDFDLFLYQFYKERGLISDLLEQEGDRADEFLSKHDEISWIRCIDRKEYGKARETLRSIAYSASTADRKKTTLSLAKLAALCEDETNIEDVAQITNELILLEHQAEISPGVMAVINPDNVPMSIEEIVNADIGEKTAEGYLKALLVLTAAIDSREGKTEVGASTIDKLRNRIWASIPGADDWSVLTQTDEERTVEFMQRSKFAETVEHLQLAPIPADLKLNLLPESTVGIKNAFPLKQNVIARQIFDRFIDDSIELIRRTAEQEQAENIPMVH